MHESSLILRVRDDGRGLSPSAGISAGVGISNARRRLERMYGAAAELTVRHAPAGPGVEVRIALPLNRNDAVTTDRIAPRAGLVEAAV